MKPLISCALCALFAFAVSAANATFVTNPDGSVTYTNMTAPPLAAANGLDPSTTGWMGADVWYADVTESNIEGPSNTTAQLFGAPSLTAGNLLDFDPQGFIAASNGGINPDGIPAPDITDGRLEFFVAARPGKVVTELLFSEAGDTTLGDNFGTNNPFAIVTSNIFVEVLRIDGEEVNQPINLQTDMVFTPSDGDYFLDDDGANQFAFNTAWTGTAYLNINDELTNLGISFVNGATLLGVTLDNTLTAGSQPGSSSFIQKKDFDGLSVTANIPEPTALALLALGLAPLACRRR